MNSEHPLYTLEMIQPTVEEWTAILTRLPGAHILQSRQWAELKQPNGWSSEFLVWRQADGAIAAAAAVHRKQVSLLGRCILYTPRGPLLDWANQPLRTRVLQDMQAYASQKKAIFLKLDPEVALAITEDPTEPYPQDMLGTVVRQELASSGWRFSQDQLQFRNTVLLDLSDSEEVLLQRMKQKTRYNIRLAQKKGVVVRPGREEDLELLYHMYAITSARDGFAIRSREYYLNTWQKLMRAQIAYPLIAEVTGEPVSALIIFIYAGRGYYFYGMSTEQHRERMPNHLLQWEAIRLCKQKGCHLYDFWGAPDEFDPQDSMYGVYRFKEGFNGKVFLGLGAWDYPVSREYYLLYTRILPGILSLMRRAGRRRVNREVKT